MELAYVLIAAACVTLIFALALVTLLHLVRFSGPWVSVPSRQLVLRIFAGGIFSLCLCGLLLATVIAVACYINDLMTVPLFCGFLVLGMVLMLVATSGAPIFVLSNRLQGTQVSERRLASDSLARGLTIIGWLLFVPFVLAIIGGLMVGIVASGAGFILFPGMLLIILGAVTIAPLIRGSQTARRATLLWHLALAAESRRPLADDLEDLAAGVSWAYRMRLRRLIDFLNSGYSLSTALGCMPGLLPAPVVLQVRIGEEAGALGVTLRKVAEEYVLKNRPQTTSMGNNAIFWAILGNIGLTGFIVLSGLMVFIIPKFKRIFEGFDTNLPDITRALIEVSDAFVNYWYLVVPLFMFPAGAAFLVWLNEAAGLNLGLPSLSRFWPRRAAPLVLRCLALLVESGRPLLSGLKTMANEYPDRAIRGKLAYAASEVAAGGEVWNALRVGGVLRQSDADLLYAADHAGHLAWAMRSLSDGMQRRRAIWWDAVFEFVNPAMILLAGIAVLFIAAGMFMPLVKLLNDLS